MGAYFSPASAAILVSAGLDARACLLDRRTQVDHVTEMSPGIALTSVTCRDDGNCIALGTVGPHPFQFFAVVQVHSLVSPACLHDALRCLCL